MWYPAPLTAEDHQGKKLCNREDLDISMNTIYRVVYMWTLRKDTVFKVGKPT